MDDRDPPGYDDWFDEPEPPTLESGRGGRPSYETPAETEEDVWMLPEDGPRRPRRDGRRGDIVLFGAALTTTQIAILAIAALAIFMAILAAAGVFSGSPAAKPPTITTQTSLTTSTQPTTPTVEAPTKTPLQYPNTGAQVKLLQKALIALNFLTPPNKADGSFGAATRTAVENFQNANGLTADGVVGKKTLAALKQALVGLGG